MPEHAGPHITTVPFVTMPRDVNLVVEVDYGPFYARRAGAEWASDLVPSHGYEEFLWSDGWFVYIGATRRIPDARYSRTS